MRRILVTLIFLVPASVFADDWADRLTADLMTIDRNYSGDLAVWVEDIQSRQSAGLRGHETYYLASAVKLPIAVAFLQEVDAGRLSLDDKMTLRDSDYVDGAGRTNWQGPGTEFTLRHLFEQMLLVSDNTATDMIIRAMGEDRLEARLEAFPLEGLQRITSLKDVRRLVYSELSPAASGFGKDEFFRLRKADDLAERLAIIGELTDTPIENMQAADIPDAFERYYATGVNSGSMKVMSDLLAWLITEQPLSPKHQELLMSTLAKVETGAGRLKSGLPEDHHLIHKTGTQHERACNIGATWPPDSDQPVTIAVCTRGGESLEESESAIRAVARAVVASGVWDTAD